MALAVSPGMLRAQTSDFAPALRPEVRETSDALVSPAVEAVNGRIGYTGGDLNSAEGHSVDGSLTVPLGRSFGLQGDALYSRIGGADFFGGAGHLFWRNPEIGLLGVTGGGLSRSGVNTFQAGAEGEYYLGRWTLGFFAGAGSIHYSFTAPFIDTRPTRFVGRLSVDWYALDDLRLGVSYARAFDDNLFKAEAEYQTPLRGLALTAEAATGDHGYDHWLLGARYYFGANKSLQERQRRDDPRSLMPQILHSLGVYGAEVNRLGKAYVAARPGTRVPSGGSPGTYSFDTYGCSSTISVAGGERLVGHLFTDFALQASLDESSRLGGVGREGPERPPLPSEPGRDDRRQPRQ